jgi:uncharacterized membrane protein YoaT (DUF817 family)
MPNFSYAFNWEGNYNKFTMSMETMILICSHYKSWPWVFIFLFFLFFFLKDIKKVKQIPAFGSWNWNLYGDMPITQKYLQSATIFIGPEADDLFKVVQPTKLHFQNHNKVWISFLPSQYIFVTFSTMHLACPWPWFLFLSPLWSFYTFYAYFSTLIHKVDDLKQEIPNSGT